MTASDQGIVDYLNRVPWRALVVGILLLFPAYVANFLDSTSFLVVLTQVFVFAIAVVSFDLLFGYTGLLSFGHALFFGGAAYIAAILTSTFGWGYLQTAPVVFIVLAVVAVIAGAVSLRLTGVYFALLTLAIAQLAHESITQFNEITGGVNGIVTLNIPQFFGIGLANEYFLYYATFVLAVGTYLGVRRIVDSPLGRVLQGIRENEQRVQMLGIDTYRFKLISFVMSGILGGLAGFLYPLIFEFVDPSLAHWSMTGDIVLMTLIGGFGTLIGPMLGAFIFIMLQTFLSRIIEQWQFVVGLIYVLIVLFLPNGVISITASRILKMVRRILPDRG